MNKNLRISIVIPVYNEEERLASCLRSIANQRVKPYEVIVVDNNSADASRRIASRFPFVRLLNEPLQGVVHARNRGFQAARGEIIGRIDADTILPTDWTKRVTAIFGDPAIAAASGAPHYYDFAVSGIADRIDHILRARLSVKLAGDNFLWGSNMAVRRSAWRRVTSRLCSQNGIHEDFDLAIHLQEMGFKVTYEPTLIAHVSSRRIDTGFLAYASYSLVSPRTYAYHRLNSRRHMYPVIAATWICYLPGRLLYRGYDPVSGGFSLSQLFLAGNSRVDPTANVA